MVAQFTAGEWLALIQHELLLMAAVFFGIGLLDELAMDAAYVWLRLTGRAKTERLSGTDLGDEELAGMAAVFIPAWREDAVDPCACIMAASGPADLCRLLSQRS